MLYAYALNRKGLKAGSVHALNREYVLESEVRLTTSVYGILIIFNHGPYNVTCSTLVRKFISISAATFKYTCSRTPIFVKGAKAYTTTKMKGMESFLCLALY